MTEFTEKNIINWLKFMRTIIPNKEDKKLISKYIAHHTDDRDDGTGDNKYASYKIYHKFWD